MIYAQIFSHTNERRRKTPTGAEEQEEVEGEINSIEARHRENFHFISFSLSD
jgi:hypothetical protein